MYHTQRSYFNKTVHKRYIANYNKYKKNGRCRNIRIVIFVTHLYTVMKCPDRIYVLLTEKSVSFYFSIEFNVSLCRSTVIFIAAFWSDAIVAN